MTQVHVLSDPVALSVQLGILSYHCVAHLPVSHVTMLEMWQFLFASCCN